MCMADAYPLHVRLSGAIPECLRQELLPAIRAPEGWDMLIAHYLGMDHIGHVHGAHGPAMAAKEAEMNDHVQQVGLHARWTASPSRHADAAFMGHLSAC